MKKEVLEWSAGEIASQISKGSITATEVVKTFIEQKVQKKDMSYFLEYC